GHGFTIPFIPDQQTCRFLVVSNPECRKALLREDAGVVWRGVPPPVTGLRSLSSRINRPVGSSWYPIRSAERHSCGGTRGWSGRGIISPGLDPAPFFPSFPLKNTPDTSFLSSLLELSSPPCSPIFN
ncbi:MAG TPA: hypothetical protein PLE70_08330, partial [Methanolinea sp.]|nr:hypothetical protein [Methanolinea sp.]